MKNKLLRPVRVLFNEQDYKKLEKSAEFSNLPTASFVRYEIMKLINSNSTTFLGVDGIS